MILSRFSNLACLIGLTAFASMCIGSDQSPTVGMYNRSATAKTMYTDNIEVYAVGEDDEDEYPLDDDDEENVCRF